MTSPPLRETVDFMMRARSVSLQELRTRSRERMERNIDTVAATLRNQMERGGNHLNQQLEMVTELKPFESSEQALEQARNVVQVNRTVMQEQESALVETEMALAASHAANMHLENVLKKHLEELQKKTLSIEAERVCKAGEQQCRNLATGDKR